MIAGVKKVRVVPLADLDEVLGDASNNIIDAEQSAVAESVFVVNASGILSVERRLHRHDPVVIGREIIVVWWLWRTQALRERVCIPVRRCGWQMWRVWGNCGEERRVVWICRERLDPVEREVAHERSTVLVGLVSGRKRCGP